MTGVSLFIFLEKANWYIQVVQNCGTRRPLHEQMDLFFADILNQLLVIQVKRISIKTKRPLGSGYLGGLAVTGLLRNGLCNKIALCYLES